MQRPSFKPTRTNLAVVLATLTGCQYSWINRDLLLTKLAPVAHNACLISSRVVDVMLAALADVVDASSKKLSTTSLSNLLRVNTPAECILPILFASVASYTLLCYVLRGMASLYDLRYRRVLSKVAKLGFTLPSSQIRITEMSVGAGNNFVKASRENGYCADPPSVIAFVHRRAVDEIVGVGFGHFPHFPKTAAGLFQIVLPRHVAARLVTLASEGGEVLAAVPGRAAWSIVKEIKQFAETVTLCKHGMIHCEREFTVKTIAGSPAVRRCSEDMIFLAAHDFPARLAIAKKNCIVLPWYGQPSTPGLFWTIQPNADGDLAYYTAPYVAGAPGRSFFETRHSADTQPGHSGSVAVARTPSGALVAIAAHLGAIPSERVNYGFDFVKYCAQIRYNNIKASSPGSPESNASSPSSTLSYSSADALYDDADLVEDERDMFEPFGRKKEEEFGPDYDPFSKGQILDDSDHHMDMSGAPDPYSSVREATDDLCTNPVATGISAVAPPQVFRIDTGIKIPGLMSVGKSIQNRLAMSPLAIEYFNSHGLSTEYAIPASGSDAEMTSYDTQMARISGHVPTGPYLERFAMGAAKVALKFKPFYEMYMGLVDARDKTGALSVSEVENRKSRGLPYQLKSGGFAARIENVSQLLNMAPDVLTYIASAKPESSPGVQLATLALFKGCFVELNGKKWDQKSNCFWAAYPPAKEYLMQEIATRVHSLLKYVANPDEILALTEQQFYDEGLYGVFRLFIKRELTSAEKIRDKRPRLIWGACLTDYVISKLILAPAMESLLSAWDTSLEPAFGVGIGFDDTFNKIVTKKFRGWQKNRKQVLALDASAFDLHIRTYARRGLLKALLAVMGLPKFHSDLLEVFYTAACRPQFVFSTTSGNSVLYCLPEHLRGLIASGEYATSLFGTEIQTAFGFGAGAIDVFSQGDDAVLELVSAKRSCIENFVRDYNAFGNFGVIQTTDRSNVVSFCSTLYDLKSSAVYPENLVKILSKYSLSPKNAEQKDAIRRMLASHPDRIVLTSVLEEMESAGINSAAGEFNFGETDLLDPLTL